MSQSKNPKLTSKTPQTTTAPSKSYLGSLISELWTHIEPKNTLKKTFFISSEFHHAFRLFMLLVNTITFFWTIVRTPAEFGLFRLMSYLTIWGFLTCFVYSILVVAWGHVEDNSTKWKVTYILGEVGFALEFMICPFYFVVLFPGLYPALSQTDLCYEMTIHLVVPIMIYLEVIFNDLAFPPGHRFIVNTIIVTYLLNNMVWTMIKNEPVYGPVDWVSPMSYILKTLGGLTVFGGFALGGVLYRWKRQKHLNDDKELKNI